jgi:hypothetical protein
MTSEAREIDKLPTNLINGFTICFFEVRCIELAILQWRPWVHGNPILLSDE